MEWFLATIVGSFLGFSIFWFFVRPLIDKWIDGEQ